MYVNFSDNVSSVLFNNAGRPETYGDCFVESLVAEAEKDKDIVVVHAGITSEPSLELFREKFPDRIFNMGVAEQHAVTFASGLSCGGLKPFCIIPSSFLQRAYDQVQPYFSLIYLDNHYMLLTDSKSFSENIISLVRAGHCIELLKLLF